MAENKPNRQRGYISFAFVMILGLILGVFIKNVRIGLIIGLVLGLLGSGLLRRR